MSKTRNERKNLAFFEKVTRRFPCIIRCDEDDGFLCVFCNCKVNTSNNRLFFIKQHINTEKHSHAVALRLAAADEQQQNYLPGEEPEGKIVVVKSEPTAYATNEHNDSVETNEDTTTTTNETYSTNNCIKLVLPNETFTPQTVDDNSESGDEVKAAKNTTQNGYEKDLLQFMLDAGISLNKLDSDNVQTFLQKYTKLNTPTLETLITNYVPNAYYDVLKKLRQKMHDNYIWTSMDEIVDANERYIVNMTFGMLGDEYGKTYLLNMACLQVVNASTIAGFFTNSLQLLWPNGIDYDKVLLVVTKSAAATHMNLAMESLRTLFPKMLPVTCFAETLNQMVDYVRVNYKKIDTLITTTNEVFKTMPSCCQLLKRRYPNLKLPTNIAKEQYSTWLHVVNYFHKNFNALQMILSEQCDQNAASIKATKKLFGNAQLLTELDFIEDNFWHLIDGLNRLKKSSNSLSQSVSILTKIQIALREMPGSLYYDEYIQILEQSKGYTSLLDINRKFSGNNEDIKDRYVSDLNDAELKAFQCFTCTFSGVAQLFPHYKTILDSSNATAYTFNQLKMIMIVMCCDISFSFK